jgi:cation diffusion facilitator family transporter
MSSTSNGRTEHDDGRDESRPTVLLALLANLGIAVLKLIAGLVTGSGALLSEAAHSAGDSTTELLLLTALQRSRRPADRRHPFGYGKERYFWSLLAAMAIFTVGAGYSAYQGVHTLTRQPEQSRAWLNYLVLGGAAILEAISLRQGLVQARRGAQRRRRSLGAHIRDADDPTVKSVVVEDSAALAGIAVAALGVGLHELTGSATYDGLASLVIAGLLLSASFAVARTCKDLLVGQQADHDLVDAIHEWLEDQPEIVDVVDLLTMLVGIDRVLVGARVDIVDSVSSVDLERAFVRMDVELRQAFPALGEIFLEPVPRADPHIRDRVLRRYGRVLADDEPR